MKVLVAEDERATRFRIVTCLREWGHEVIEATDGAEAWEKFQQSDPAIIITDWLMPKLDGVGLIRNIRGDLADKTYHYIILLTARSEINDVVEGIEVGADDFVAKPFDRDELRVRVQAGERIIHLEQALEDQNSQLEASNREILKANTRMRESLRSAATIQKSFLPPAEQQIGKVHFVCRYLPCEELAGDTMNVIPLDETAIAIYAIDVSGHGVQAALLSVHLSRILTRLHGPEAILRTTDPEGRVQLTRPREVLEKLNRKFKFDAINQQYFSMIYGLLDLKTQRFCYCSAGHPGPLVFSQGEATILPSRPPAVGFLPDAQFIEETLELEVGDRLLFYTDGAFEPTDGEDREFGEQRLAKSFTASVHAGGSAKDSLDAVLAAARDWHGDGPFEDDISLLLAELSAS